MRENDLQQNPITYPTSPVMKLGYDYDMVGWHGLEIVKVYPSISTALSWQYDRECKIATTCTQVLILMIVRIICLNL